MGVPAYCAPRLLRPLDTNEALFHAFAKLGAFATVQVLELAGDLSETRLRRAMHRWVAMHPRIVHRIVETADGPAWQATRDAVPLTIVSGRAVTATQLAEAALNAPMASDGPLLSVTWASLSHRQLLCFAIHHSLADGMSAYRLAADLVDLINDTEGRIALHEEPGGERTLDDVIPHVSFMTDVSHRLDRIRRRLRKRTFASLRLDASAPADERSTRLLFDAFDAPTVSRLRGLGRRHKASVGGILTAALMIAIARLEEVDGPCEVSSQVSLRKHGSPVIAHTAIGCYAGRVLTEHVVGPFWQLARDCTLQVKRAVRRGEAEAAVVRTRGRVAEVAALVAGEIADPTRCGRSCILAISNRGVMPAPRPDGRLRLTKYFSAVANHAVGASVQVSCGTLAGELHCSLMYVAPLMSNARATAIWQTTRELLLEAAGSAIG